MHYSLCISSESQVPAFNIAKSEQIMFCYLGEIIISNFKTTKFSMKATI